MDEWANIHRGFLAHLSGRSRVAIPRWRGFIKRPHGELKEKVCIVGWRAAVTWSLAGVANRVRLTLNRFNVHSESPTVNASRRLGGFLSLALETERHHFYLVLLAVELEFLFDGTVDRVEVLLFLLLFVGGWEEI